MQKKQKRPEQKSTKPKAGGAQQGRSNGYTAWQPCGILWGVE